MSSALVAFAAAPVGAVSATAPDETSLAYALPFEAGTEIVVSQGWHGVYSHTGVASYAYDFVLPAGTLVLASAGGRVAFAHAGETACGGADHLDLANYVTLYHADGTATHYGHLAGVSVVVGQVVTAGQVIGRLGSTGFTNCDPHLHFARQAQGGPVTPSIPIFFAEYPGRELLAGERVVGGLAATGEILPVEVEHVVEVELRADVAMRQAARQRIQAVRAVDARPYVFVPVVEPGLPFRIARQLLAP